MPPHANGMPRSTSGIEKRVELGGHAQVATRRHDDAAADAPAVQPRDRDGAHLVERPAHPPALLAILGGRGRRDRRQVGARRERPPGARDDDDLQIVVLVEPPRGLLDLAQRVRAERIQLVRAVEAQRAALAVDGHSDGVERGSVHAVTVSPWVWWTI